MFIDVFGNKIEISDCVFTDRDLKTQFPLQVYDIWKKWIKKDDVVLDIGSYIGLISIHFVFLGAFVHAFEGSLRNISRFKTATDFLKNRIQLHEVALSNIDKECLCRFNDCVDREHPVQKINYVRYDSYSKLKNIGSPKFVKMDIEGMETVALNCMEELIQDVKPIWQIEFHKNLPFKYEDYPGYVDVKDGGFDFHLFEKYGYVIFDEKMKKISVSRMQVFKNYFFIPCKIL